MKPNRYRHQAAQKSAAAGKLRAAKARGGRKSAVQPVTRKRAK